jgi:histidine triad (HIT) family protein
MSSDSCIFCKIVAGEASAHRVYEDADTIAFMDVFPATDGHVLVVPKRHAENIFELHEADVAKVARSAQIVARAIRSVWAPDGLTVSQANGRAAGQTVDHYHVHLIPRRDGQPRRAHGEQAAEPAHLNKLAGELAEALS